MKFSDAIYKRKSVRAFANHEIEPDLIMRIKLAIDSAARKYKDVQINVVISDYCRKSFLAPYYIGIYTDGSRRSEINAGYVLQQVVIYLTAIGIATCYQADNAIFREKDYIGRKMTIALALGYPGGNMYRSRREIKRMKTDKICVYKEEPNTDMKELLELARVSPSAYNTQPWRFVVYSNRMHVFLKKSRVKRIANMEYINMGIMLANIVIGAEEKWIDICMKEQEELKYKKIGSNEYILTVFNRNGDGRRI